MLAPMLDFCLLQFNPVEAYTDANITHFFNATAAAVVVVVVVVVVAALPPGTVCSKQVLMTCWCSRAMSCPPLMWPR